MAATDRAVHEAVVRKTGIPPRFARRIAEGEAAPEHAYDVNVNDYLTHLTSLLFPSAPTCHSRSHQCKLPNFGYSSFIFLSTGTSFSL